MLSPIDLIPDSIPVPGLLDEALLLPGLIWLAEGDQKPHSWLGGEFNLLI